MKKLLAGFLALVMILSTFTAVTLADTTYVDNVDFEE